MKVKCEVCNIVFDRKPSEVLKHVYCSVKCFKIATSKDKTLNGRYNGGKHVECIICGKKHYRTPYKLKASDNYFCSVKCHGVWQSQTLIGEKATNYKGDSIRGLCEFCGKKFIKNNNRGKFCSFNCYTKSRDGLRDLKCDMCGKVFKRSKSQIAWSKKRGGGNAFFCSNKCFGDFYSGKRHQNWIEDRSKLKDRHKTIRESKKMIVWRSKIYKRDNWTCQLCGARSKPKRQVILNAHHIKKFNDYPELRFDINNGVTLCEECHSSTKWHEEDFESVFWPNGYNNCLIRNWGENG